MSTTTGGTSMANEVDEYISEQEQVNAVSAGDTRTFAVTDRRVLDIQQTESATGKSIENIETTLFTDVAKVDVSIQGSTTNTDTMKMVAGILFGLLGVVVAFLGLDTGGDGAAIGVVVGLILLGLAIWLLMNATERIPGGIRIDLRHKTPDDTVSDRYILPESQAGTARAVVRSVGGAHRPSVSENP